MNPAIRISTVRGQELQPHLSALAALRIAVFREWPYLYEGSAEYETTYLQRYANSADSLTVLCHRDQQLIGASTALPMADAEPAMQQPLQQAGIALDRVLYYGESLVLPHHRGQGLGQEFFRQRERHAGLLGLDLGCFCAVERDPQHPARPPNHRGNEAFWLRQGYRPSAMICQFDWPDIGADSPTTKPLRFWTKPL